MKRSQSYGLTTMLDSKKILFSLFSFYLIFVSTEIFAHGERAQQAGLRMRAMNWIDVEVSHNKVQVNDIVTVKGKFVPSIWWPEHMPSPEGAAFLNVGVPGPVFVRLDSRVNGIPTIRSQHYKLGETYEFEITLKARTPGRYHLHPIINVEGTGPVIGPGRWIEITGDQKDFVNLATTLTGQTIDLESYGFKEFIWLHVFWIIVAFAWVFYWFRKLPVIMPRYNKVIELGDDANQLITIQDMAVSFAFFLFTLIAITGGYFWAQNKYPITTPLQTSKINIPLLAPQEDALKIVLKDARYRIPGRSFKVTMEITNYTDRDFQIGEFMTANIRFINKDVLPDIKKVDDNDLIASQGLYIEGGVVSAGETKTLTMYADDALWETYRLTSLIYDPDSRFAGMLFFFDDQGNRLYYEIGGAMLPVFN